MYQLRAGYICGPMLDSYPEAANLRKYKLQISRPLTLFINFFSISLTNTFYLIWKNVYTLTKIRKERN